MFLQEDSLRVGEAAAHPRLAAAGAARGGAGADHRGVRASVRARLGAGGRPAAARARWSSCSIAPTAWAPGDTWTRAQQAARQAVGPAGPSIASRWCCSRPRRRAGAALERRRRRASCAEIDRGAAVAPAPPATRPAMKLASSVLAESSLPRKEAVLVSRLPARRLAARRGVPPARRQRVHAGARWSRAPPRTCRSRRSRCSACRRRTRSAWSITGGVINRGAAAATNVRLELEVDGRVVQSQPVSRGRRQFRVVRLSRRTVPPAGPARGRRDPGRRARGGQRVPRRRSRRRRR